jgi:uncharacterized membrane protein YgaE (UPF0421/DUF939 family)
MYTVDQISLATSLAACLIAALIAVILSFQFKRRSIFLFAVAGILLMQLIPQPDVRSSYQIVEGAVMGSFSESFWETLKFSLVGMCAGIILAFAFFNRNRSIERPQPQ